MCLKINSKLAGTNHKLERNSRPKMFSEPVMILGADVTHAAAQFKGQKPSIAAVVGSVDPSAHMQYEVEIRVQETEQNEEMIQDMENIVKKLLHKFERIARQRPKRLIMFRDGVSEGQFQSVMARELLAIRAACSRLGDGSYKPPISYIVVQKRHHTRLVSVNQCHERQSYQFFLDFSRLTTTNTTRTGTPWLALLWTRASTIPLRGTFIS